jgi:hypothetical protein
MINFCLFLLSFIFAYLVVRFLFAKFAKKKNKRRWLKIALISLLLTVPFNINGNIFTILGSAVNEEGNIYSLFSFYQEGKTVVSIFTLAGYQRAEKKAWVIVGLGGYQKATEAMVGVGLAGYQRAEGGAVVGIGLAGYQGATQAVVVIGLAGYQRAEEAATIGVGLAACQGAGKDAIVEVGLAACQGAGEKAKVELGLAGYQRAEELVYCIGFVGYQSIPDKNRACGLFYSKLGEEKP